MDALTTGADIATIATGLSAVTAAYVWVRNQLHIWRQQKAATELRNWHGYLMPENTSAWYVAVADGTDISAGRIVLDVLDVKDGKPDAMIAEGMRRVIAQDGMLSGVPTPNEYDFLKYLRKERGYGKGIVVR